MRCRRWLTAWSVVFGAYASYALWGACPAQAQERAAPIEQLIETVSEAADPQARASAAERLGSLDAAPARVAPVLVEVLGWDGDAMVRGRAAEALGRIGPATESVVPALIEALAGDDQLRVRWRAAEALERIGVRSDDVVPALIGALQEDESPGVRARAAQALGGIGPATDEVIPALVRAFRHDGHPGVRWQAATALERCALRLREARAAGSIESLKEALAALSGDAHPDVQRNASAVREAIQELGATQEREVAK